MKDLSKAHDIEKGLLNIADFILEKSNKYGATSASCCLTYSQSLDISVADSKISSLEFGGGYSLGFSVYFGNKTASCSSSSHNLTDIDLYIQQLCDKIKYLEDDPFAGLPDKNNLAFSYNNLELYRFSAVSVNEHIQNALETEKIALEYNNNIRQCEDVSISANQAMSVLANSYGFCGNYNSSYYNHSCCLLAQESNNHMHRDYYYSNSRNSSHLLSAKKIAQAAAERTLARLGARSIKSCKSRVLFSVDMSKSLLNYFLSAVSGGSIYRKSSFLQDMIGLQVFPNQVSIVNNPHIISGMGSCPFDAEGVKTQKRTIVSNGILQTYLLSTYTARALGLVTTGNAGGFHNVIISTGKNNFTKMLASLHTGIYVVEMMGNGINLVNGDFSVGAFGYWVENGKILHPINGITIAANLKDMFLNVEDIGCDVDNTGSIHTGSWLIKEITIAGS